MAEQKQLNTAWLAQPANAHHDGTTQQIDDFVQAFQTDNAVLTQKKATLHQARQTEDEVWLKEQRDAAVPQLEAADRQQVPDESLRQRIGLGTREHVTAVLQSDAEAPLHTD